MLKNIIIKCAELLNRDDIIDAIQTADDVSDIQNKQIQNDVTRLIHYYNFTLHAACENYLNLTSTETLESDQNKKIYFYQFDFMPVRILDVRDEGGKCMLFEVSTCFILTTSPNKLYKVTYKYIPPAIESLSEKTQFPENLSEKTLVYGIISEFLASKNQYSQSEFWRNKFLQDLFKLNIQKERRLKSTF